VISFDDIFSADEGYFGDRPEEILVAHLADLDRKRPVLDIGCGQGRHALYLADNGFTVDALDPSAVAIEQVARAAADRRLPVRAIRGTFRDQAIVRGAYGAVLVFGLVPLLERSEIEALAEMVTSALAPRGLLFITAFGTWDPAWTRRASEWREVGANSFRGPGGELRTYLEPGELSRFFPTFEVIHSWEGLGPEHRHGAAAVERHGVAEAVLRR
jgi:tellurite methyltransferase